MATRRFRPDRSQGRVLPSYLPDDLRAGDRRTGRPALQLAVFAPDEPEAPQGPRSLYIDPKVRRNAAVTEQHIVRLPADRLTAAGVPLPGVPAQVVEGAELVVERLLQADNRQTAIDVRDWGSIVIRLSLSARAWA
jgi:hypothetical protein